MFFFFIMETKQYYLMHKICIHLLYELLGVNNVEFIACSTALIINNNIYNWIYMNICSTVYQIKIVYKCIINKEYLKSSL